MLETLLITVLIVAICTVLLALRILLKKGGRFPHTHISGNPAMKRNGISCVQSQDREARRLKDWNVRETRHE